MTRADNPPQGYGSSGGGGGGTDTDIMAWGYEDAPIAGAIEYCSPYGGAFSASTLRNFVPGKAGTLKKMTIRTNSAANDDDVVATVQISAVDSDLEITIPAASANVLLTDEDDVTFTDEDTIRIKFDSSASAGTLRIMSVVLEVVWS